MRRFTALTVFMFVLFSSTYCFSEIKELAKGQGRSETESTTRAWEGARADRVVCVDGLKVFQTFVVAGDTSGGVAVSTIQLYETRNGMVVPATCK